VRVEWYRRAGSADFLKERTWLGNQHGSMSLPIVIHRTKKEIIGLQYSLAALFGTLPGIAVNYLGTSKYVFNTTPAHISRVTRFVLVYSLQYFINVSCLWFLEQSGV
jgi:hypothetical protein